MTAQFVDHFFTECMKIFIESRRESGETQTQLNGLSRTIWTALM